MNNACHFCKNQTKKYTCPRCNADYCSLICFQSPSHTQCSENFYQTCVLEDLGLDENDAESKDKMLEVLRRFHESNADDATLDSDDDDEGLSLAERLSNVNLDDTKEVWSKLTSDERQEFEAFLRSGDVTKLVPKWQPWWSQTAKVAEVQEDNNCPKLFENIKDFSVITKKPPAECVQYNVINVIAAYVFTARYFNGDYYDFLEEALGCITYLSLCLKDNKNFSCVQEAVASVQEQSLTNDWISVDEENITSMKEDVALLLEDSSKRHILLGLSDLHRLMTTSLSHSSKGNAFTQNCPIYKVTKKDVKLYLKKIEYFLSYTLYVNKGQ